MKKIYFIFLLACNVTLSKAQVPDIRLERYTVTDGLSQNSTGPLLQDSRGFLWIGTMWGLNRYDGRQMKKYNSIGPNLLPDLHINALSEDKDGKIWIGTENGLSCFDPLTEKFKNYIQGKLPQNIPQANCKVYVDKNNSVWVTSDNGLALLNRQTNNFTIIPIRTIGSDIRKNRYIDNFFEDSKGRFWISTSFGIKLLNRNDNSCYSYHFPETQDFGKGRTPNATQGMFEDVDGNLWAGTWNGGIIKFDPVANKFISYKIAADKASFFQSVHDINGISLNNKYYLLFATEGGLLLVDPKKITGDEVPVERVIADVQGDNTNSGKFDIVRTNDSNYWVSSYQGLFKIDACGQAFQWQTLPDPPVSNIAIFHVIPSIKDPLGKIFLTTQRGWWQYDIREQRFSVFPLPAGKEDLISNVNNYLIDGNGYWFTSQSGVGYFEPDTKKLIDLSSQVLMSAGKTARTGVLCKDEKGRIWFSASRSGVRVYDPASGKIISILADSTSPGNLYGTSIFDMKAAKGYIFLCTGLSVYRIDPNNFSYKVILPPSLPGISANRLGPRRLLYTHDGRLLVLSMQCIYEYKNDQLVQVYPKQGPADFLMETMLQDTSGNIWINSNINLYKADTQLQHWTSMTAKAGGINSENILELFWNQNNQFIATTYGRIGIFSVNDIKKNTKGPAVIINRIRTGDTEQYFPSLKKENIKLSYRDAIEMDMSAINFINEKGNRIYYKLDGWDNDWKELSGNPVVRYEQLPAGTYTFTSKAMNGDGIWGDEVKLAFTVAPPFWKTWWFISLAVLVAAGILFSLYRYRVKQVIQQERMRSRIATDLHDDIGSTLSSISFYSEAIKQQTESHLPQLTPMLNRMGETSRDMVSNMSDIVWAINPNNDSVEKMINRMQSHATEICTIKNVQLYFKADEKLNELQLGMEQRRNIYMIFKEALNNSLKYSNSKNCWINLSLNDGNVKMIVKDDGKGFTLDELQPALESGNGLKNMRLRAADIQGKLLVDSNVGEGTTVTLILKIT